MREYIQRNIDAQLLSWKEDVMRKPLLIRGARQVGKSSAIRHFGKEFKYFAEVNFERHKAVKSFNCLIILDDFKRDILFPINWRVITAVPKILIFLISFPFPG